MFPFRFLPCPECGEPVDRAGVGHVCRRDRRFAAEPDLAAGQGVGTEPGLGAEMATFEYDVHRYLDTPEGQLETWVASRRVRRSR